MGAKQMHHVTSDRDHEITQLPPGSSAIDSENTPHQSKRDFPPHILQDLLNLNKKCLQSHFSRVNMNKFKEYRANQKEHFWSLHSVTKEVRMKLRQSKTDEYIPELISRLWQSIPLKICDIFNSDENGEPRRILIEGEAGIGKTSLCVKLAHDWSQGKEYITNRFKGVFLIRARSIKTSSIREYINTNVYMNQADKKQVWEYIIDPQYQNQFLFIIDGLDEVFDSLPSEFINLIEGRFLSHSCVLVTSRINQWQTKLGVTTDSSFNFDCQLFDREIVNIGFTKETAFEFIDALSERRDSQIETLQQFIFNHSFLEDLIRIPLVCILLCTMWNENYIITGLEEDEFRRTILYANMVECLVKRYCQQTRYSSYKLVDGHLSSATKEKFGQIYKIAYYALQEGNVQVSLSDVRKYLKINILSDDDIEFIFGILVKETDFLVFSEELVFLFPHTSVQEELSSEYYLIMSEEERMTAAKQIVKRFPHICIFSSGLVYHRRLDPTLLIPLFGEMANKLSDSPDGDNNSMLTTALESVFECGYKTLLTNIIAVKLPVVINLNSPTTNVVSGLLNCLNDSKSCVESERICHFSSLSRQQLVIKPLSLASIFKNNKVLKKLELAGNFKLSIDEKISLKTNNQVSGWEALSEGLKAKTALTQLDLSKYEVFDKRLEDLGGALKANNTPLKLLKYPAGMDNVKAAALYNDIIERNTEDAQSIKYFPNLFNIMGDFKVLNEVIIMIENCSSSPLKSFDIIMMKGEAFQQGKEVIQFGYKTCRKYPAYKKNILYQKLSSAESKSISKKKINKYLLVTAGQPIHEFFLVARDTAPYLILILSDETNDSGENQEYFNQTNYLKYMKVINYKKTNLSSVKNTLAKSDKKNKFGFEDFVTPRGFSFDEQVLWAIKTPIGTTKTVRPAMEVIKIHDILCNKILVDMMPVIVVNHCRPINLHIVYFNDLGVSSRNLIILKKALQDQRYQIRKPVYREFNAHPHIASALNNLGSVFNSLGDYEMAITYYESTYQMLKQIYGENSSHPQIASSLANLASAFNSLGNYETSIIYQEQAYQMFKQVFGERAHPEVAKSLNNLALVYSRLKNYKLAVMYHEQVYQMRKKIYGEDAVHPEIVNSLNNLGKAWYHLGNYEKAIEFYEKSLIVNKEIYEELTDHSSIADSLNNLGDVWYKKESFEKAIQFHEESLKMRKELFDNENNAHPKIANSLYNLGNDYFSLGVFDKAIIFYEESLVIYRKLYGKDFTNSDIATSIMNIGIAQIYFGNYHKATLQFLKFLRLFESIYGGKHPDIALSFANLGNAYSKMGYYQRALIYYKKAFPIVRQIYGSAIHNPNITLLRNNLKITLRNMFLKRCLYV